jgi:dTDP-4-dehydrorhamnose reductase
MAQHLQPNTEQPAAWKTRMILLLGASGYIGRTFASELRRRGHSFIPLTRRAFDYSRFDFLFDYLRTMKPVFLINAASYCAASNASALRAEREKMMAANAILPQMIARACSMTKTPWGNGTYIRPSLRSRAIFRRTPRLG